MSVEDIQEFFAVYPNIGIPVAIVLAYLLFRLTRFILARGSFWIAFRTETTYDDLIVDALYPFRVAWLLPLENPIYQTKTDTTVRYYSPFQYLF